MKTNPREEIIAMMRGFFVCPIISFLHSQDLIQMMLGKSFSVEKFKKVKNKHFLNNIFLYFTSLGILTTVKKSKSIFKATFLGKKILKRSGSFLLIHSYKPFIDELKKNIISTKNPMIECNRAENVVGSGSTNNKKFFPSAINLLNRNEIDLVADIGCGDGNFLYQLSKKFPGIPVFASDISKIAVNTTKNNLLALKSKKKFFVCDASNVKKWSKEIKKFKIGNDAKILVSIWYILHEISKNKPKLIIKFFKELKKNLPNAVVLIGEITRFDHKTLANNKALSIMPEFLFFHELSGQGVLKYEEFKYILKKIPYKLEKNIKFDQVKSSGKKVPSAFIWYLK